MADGPRAHGINWSDLFAGLGLAVLCCVFVLKAPAYGIGTPARMGSGFFSFAFGLVGIGLGVVIFVRSFLIPGKPEIPFRWRPLLFVSGGVIAFGLTIEYAGLLPAVLLSTLITAAADRASRPVGTVVLGLVLTAGVWLVFVKGLGLPIRLFGTFG